MLISELIDHAQRHLLRYGDGEVCAETRTHVHDVVKADADVFTPCGGYALVLVLEDEGPPGGQAIG